jgi:hypothetical protein
MSELTEDQQANAADWKRALEQDRESINRYTQMIGDPQLTLSRQDRDKYEALIGFFLDHAALMEAKLRELGVEA